MEACRKIWKGKIFISFLISYIMVLLIPLVIGIVAYNEALKVVERDAREASLSSLKTCMVALDRRFAEVEGIATQLAINPKVLSFAREYNPYIDPTVPCKINDLKEEIAPLAFTNNFIGMLSIYFNKSDVTISADKSHLKLARFYDEFFRYGNLNDSEWHERILSGKYFKEYFPVTPVYLCVNYDQNRWEVQPMLMYMQSFPLGSLDRGHITVLISKTKIEELIRDVTMEQGGWAYIIDSRNNVLASFSAPEETIPPMNFDMKGSSGFFRQKTSGQDMIVTYATSSYNGWRYMAVLPYHVVMERVQYIKQLIYAILAISILLGILGSFMMAYRSSKPIRNIIDIIREMIGGNDSNNNQNEYIYLRRSILNLVSNNRSMQESLNKQLHLLKATFVERLLSGGFSNLKEIHGFLEQLGFERFDGKIAVAIARVDQSGEDPGSHILQEMGAIKVILKNTMERYLGTNIYYHDLDFEKRVVVFAVDGDKYHNGKAHVEEILNNVWEDMYESHNISVFFTVGTLAENYMSINRSFDEAREALDYKTLQTSKRILWYSDIPRKSESYYYPLNIETHLINYAKLGNCKEIERIVKRICKENFVKRSLSTVMMTYLLYEMRGTMLKILDMLSVEHGEDVNRMRDKVHAYDACISMDEMLAFMLEIYEDICRLAGEGKKSKNDVMEGILYYINTNHMDPQLSLTGLADRFNFAPAYLSQLFKEVTGENFSFYLEQIRVKKACELLQKGAAINEAARKVGYNNVHVFRKAFKRAMGLAPSEYKEGREMLELYKPIN